MTERERWLDEVTATLERRIAAAGARPDFLDVVARAHAIDPQAVPADERQVVEALGLEPEAVVTGEPSPTRQEAILDEWLGDVRAAMEGHLEARRRGPTPVLAVRRERRAAWWIAGAALAAGIVLVLGAMQVVRRVAMDPDVRSEQALHLSDRPEPAGEVAEQAPERASEAQPRAVVEPETVEPEASEPEASEPEPPAPLATSDRSALAKELATLADEAQAHWRAGRRDEAQRLFARIVARGGRSRAAEMAFADLFTLAHQRADARSQRRWWQAYLRRFPAGRFADDARAGLCRGRARAEQETCWAEYLEDFPHGSFRAEARTARGDDPQ
jgi:hypothetical protein